MIGFISLKGLPTDFTITSLMPFRAWHSPTVVMYSVEIMFGDCSGHPHSLAMTEFTFTFYIII